MSVVVSVEDVGPCRRQLTVEVPAPAVDAETRRVVEELRREVELPGFRKGKVPLSVVQRRFQERIDREVLDRLLPRYWKQAEAESKLDALLPPEVGDVDHRPGERLTFTATVEVRPEIRLGSLDGFTLPEPSIEPTAAEIEGALEGMRRDAGAWSAVDRGAGRGDQVTARLSEEREEGEGANEGRPVTFEVGDPGIWEELSTAAQGMAAGQQGRFKRREETDAGPRERSFSLLVEEVRERELPPLDDDLARRVAGLASVEDLRREVAEGIRRAKARERRRLREGAVLDQLRDRHPLVLPPGVVEAEVRDLVEEYARSLKRRGVDPERAGVDGADVAAQARPQAERRVHGRLLLDAIAEARQVQVDEAEFERFLAGLARAQRTSPGAMRQALDRSGRLATLRRDLRRDKVVRMLLGEGEEGGEGTPAPPVAGDAV